MPSTKTQFEFWKHLQVDPKICHGQLCFQGTRIMVYQVLDALAEGASAQEILNAYPSLSREHIRAAIAFGAEVARDETFLPLASGQKS